MPCGDYPTEPSKARTRPGNARENYDRLASFASFVRNATLPNQNAAVDAVRVVNGNPPLDLGLQAARNITQGEIVVWYGGPYCPLEGMATMDRTHSAHVIDPVEGADQVPRAIDGKILSAAFQDAVVTELERQKLLLIAGSLANSTLPDNEDGEGMKWGPSDLLLRWRSPDGIEFAARPFVATRDIPEGTDLLWNYVYYEERVTEPLGFKNMLPPPPDSERRKPNKRVIPLANPNGK